VVVGAPPVPVAPVLDVAPVFATVAPPLHAARQSAARATR
jgi:hypothetical protein